MSRSVEELRALIKKAKDAYYNLDPIMDDQTYDALFDELKRASPEDEEVRSVGAEPPKISVWEKVRHKIAMGSLEKVNDKGAFLEWAAGTGSERFLFTHKIDGSSMELVYEGGRLVRCVTRGDGKVGEDVTENVSRIPSVPGSVPVAHEEVTVRGEVVMHKSVFQSTYADKYANPRNTAAGKVRDKKGGGKDCENLTFMAFTLMSPSAPKSESLRMKALGKMGFTVPEHAVGTAEEGAAWHARTAEVRDGIPYEIDGTVFRVEDVAAQEALGEHNLRPRGQMAYKFESAKGVTRVLDVKWQVGPTGRITPVASVEPVEIGGVTITSVSLHNLAMFKELGLFPGCQVLVSRRNDVIPYIESNLDAKTVSDVMES